jgi:2-desacetyl-2-hydroxyethyl bacteriochlorophyllide A dehydrogenase
MKAMVLEDFHRPLVWRQLLDPTCGDQEVVLRVQANGLCATDLKIVDGVVPTVPLPHVLGHETAGEAVEVGAEVRGLEIGDHVTIYPTQGCGFCDACRMGIENYCLAAPRTGFEIDGGFSEYLQVPGRNAVKIAPEVPWEQAAIIPDAIASSYHALTQKARLQVGETVIIVGLGGLGIHALQLALSMGARVIAADVAPDKLAAARGYEPEAVVNSGEAALPEAVKLLTGGRGADVVLECVAGGAVPNVLKDCLDCLKLGGRLVVMGYGYSLPLTVDTAELVYGQWSILGTRASTLQDVVDVARLVESSRLTPVVSERFPMEQANEAMAVLRENSPLGRIVLQ